MLWVVSVQSCSSHVSVYKLMFCQIWIKRAFSDKKEHTYIENQQQKIDICSVNNSLVMHEAFVNLALHRPAYQSSNAFNGTADRAVDGDTTKNYYTGQ